MRRLPKLNTRLLDGISDFLKLFFIDGHITTTIVVSSHVAISCFENPCRATTYQNNIGTYYIRLTWGPKACFHSDSHLWVLGPTSLSPSTPRALAMAATSLAPSNSHLM